MFVTSHRTKKFDSTSNFMTKSLQNKDFQNSSKLSRNADTKKTRFYFFYNCSSLRSFDKPIKRSQLFYATLEQEHCVKTLATYIEPHIIIRENIRVFLIG